MIRFLADAALLLVPCVAAAAPPDPFKLYDSEMDFAAYRSGSETGRHTVTFASEGGTWLIRSLFDIAVKFLGVTVYTFKYQSPESWRDRERAALTSTVDDNGTESKVETREKGDALVVNGPEAKGEVVDLPLLPSTHWDAQVIDASRVLNTLNGKVDDIKLVGLGPETVTVAGAPRVATHYRYTGDIVTTDAWYEQSGHWVKLRFPGKDGTPIDYVCLRCAGTP